MMENLEVGELICFPHLLNTSCRKPAHFRSESILLYSLLPPVTVLTVALNLLVIISISHYRQLHTPTNFFLLSLAVTDLLTGLLMPSGILLTAGCWFLGDLMCTLYLFVIFTVISVSVGNMVLISVDRYVAICDPLRYPTRITQRRVKVYIFMCWVCSVFYSILTLKDLLAQPGRYNSCIGECVATINSTAGAIDLVLTFIVPITVIIVLYMRVFVVAVTQARAMRSHIVAARVTVTAKKSERKAARTLGVVIAVFLVCFCPYYCLSLASLSSLSSASSLAIALSLIYINSCLNPVIYAFFYPWFRKAMKLIVTLQILQPASYEANIL